MDRALKPILPVRRRFHNSDFGERRGKLSAMAAVLSRSGVVWHALPERLEPAAMNQVGEKIPDRTRSQERQNWVLLNRTAHSPAAFAEVAARLGIAVQSFSRVARAGLVSI